LRINMQDGDQWASVVLGEGERLNCPPGVEHQFETSDIPCSAFEFYWPDGCKPDIVRQPG
jgi:hypothetical protein